MAVHSENDVATKKDLENLKQELKQDFRNELSKYATKEALEVVARQVLKNSNDIAELKVEMKNGFQRVDQRLDNVEIRLDSLDNKFDIMMTAIDGIAKGLQNGKTEKSAVDHALTRHEKTIDNHETRILNLETKTA
ncbi:MAG: hypothetical protein ACOY90_12555 [Candidatus Zhuqueibacterota bacterium]